MLRIVDLDRLAGATALLAFAGCATSDGARRADGGPDGADASIHDASDAAPASDLENGASCSTSSQCRGGCCELRRSTTTCAQIAPFDSTQSCACALDDECAAVRLCGQPGFCQALTEPLEQRFCSRVCR